MTKDVHPPQLRRGRGFDFRIDSRLPSASGGRPVSGNFINASYMWLALDRVVGVVPSPRCPWGNARRIGGTHPPIRRRPAGPTALSGAVFGRSLKITPSGSRRYLDLIFNLGQGTCAAHVAPALVPSRTAGPTVSPSMAGGVVR